VNGIQGAEAGAALTVRETEVLRLNGPGIGQQGDRGDAGISAHTAKYHVASVLAKLTRTRGTEAVTRG